MAVKYLIKLDNNKGYFFRTRDSINSNNNFTVGPANFDGHMIFDCVPAEGIIVARNSSKINVNFNPDHSSLLFADQARVYISNKVCA